MSLNIIGISANYHDAACCLLHSGVLVAAAEEERFTRIKHDPSIPVNAFKYCLREAGLSLTDIDCVAYYENPRKKLERQLWTLSGDALVNPTIPAASPTIPAAFLNPDRPLTDIREILGYEGKVEFFGHHQSHAASAYFYSGYQDAAVLTADGVGEWATTTYWSGAGSSLTLLDEVNFPHSLGLLYSALTAYLGFEVNDGEYKVMGLAPYGHPIYLQHLRQLIDVREGGAYLLNMQYFNFCSGMYTENLCDLLGHAPRQPESELTQFAMDVAKSLQILLEEVLLNKTIYLYKATGSDNLCMAGGVALNCVANARILRDSPFQNIFVQPAASDAGCCLGAAACAYINHTGVRHTQRPLKHVYLGPSFSDETILATLEDSRAWFEDCRADEGMLVNKTVRRLADGKVVAWFQGRMEFGPRALGSRSILADPRRPEIRDKINALIKMREAFRPFAPSVLDQYVCDHFDLTTESPFMLLTCGVTSHLELGAITHVDGSARVQTVERVTNPLYYRLIDSFFQETGCPILLNTSFNMRGEPIVCTPIDALLCFICSDLDSLALGSYILDRARVPQSFIEFIRSSFAITYTSGVRSDAYTFV